MEKLRILQVSPFFHPAALATGPANVARSQSRILVQRGHEVSVYTSNTNDSSSGLNGHKVTNIDGIAVHYFPSFSHKLAANHRIIFCPQLLNIAGKQISSFDIVHLHDYRTFNNVIISNSARKAGIPYVLQAHGTTPRIIEKRWLKHIFDIGFGRRMLRNAAKLIALSPLELEQYFDIGMARVQIMTLPNAIDPPRGLLPQAGQRFREKHQINRRDFVILFLGRIHKIKGLDLLVSAFKGVLNRLQQAVLVVAGPDDRYLSTLKRMVKELNIESQVILTGNLSGEDKWFAIQASDVLVIPSLYEMFPLVVLEAWAMGKPVIVNPENGLVDWVRKGGGVVVPHEELALENALIELLTQSKVRDNLGKIGQQLVEQNFTWDRVISRLESLYCDAIALSGKI